MKRIQKYGPPSAGDLARIKRELNFTSPQMADLAGLAQGAQWRKYTGGATPRELGMQMHFYMAAMLALTHDELVKVIELMRSQGAEVELATPPTVSNT